MFFIFILLAIFVGVPLYLDYKKNPTDNITTRTVTTLSENDKLKPLLAKIEPHSMKYGVNPVFALGGGIILVLIILIIIF